MTERLDRRTGLENWDGRPLLWRGGAAPRSHEHFCAPGDHHWRHETLRCLRPDAAACVEVHPPDPPRVLTRERRTGGA